MTQRFFELHTLSSYNETVTNATTGEQVNVTVHMPITAPTKMRESHEYRDGRLIRALS